MSSVVPVELRPATILPVIPTANGAPTSARIVSLVRPTDARSNLNIQTILCNPRLIGVGGIGGGVGLGVVDSIKFVTAGDPTLWVENAFAASLENAGYNITRVESVSAANAPTILTISLTELTSGIPPGIHFSWSGQCNGKISVTVKLLKGSETLLDSAYQGESEQTGSCVTPYDCMNPSTIASAEEKALENLLRKAIPDINLKLRSAN